MSSLVLKSFTKEFAPLFSSWFQNPRDLYIFGGPQFQFPLNQEQISAYLNEEDKHPYSVLIANTSEIIGHCELNYTESTPTLSRLFISPEHRGKGLGQELVQLLSRKLFECESIQQIQLYVFDFNARARHCYEQVGFTICEKETTYLEVGNETWTRLKMKVDRKTFQTISNS